MSSAPQGQSTFAILAALPGQIIGLVKAELANIKLELMEKAKKVGIGIGLFAAAAAIMFFVLGVLIAAAILGLATVLPGWAAALIVAFVLILLAGLCVFIGMRQLRAATPPLEDSLESIEDDVQAIIRGGENG